MTRAELADDIAAEVLETVRGASPHRLMRRSVIEWMDSDFNEPDWVYAQGYARGLLDARAGTPPPGYGNCACAPDTLRCSRPGCPRR